MAEVASYTIFWLLKAFHDYFDDIISQSISTEIESNILANVLARIPADLLQKFKAQSGALIQEIKESYIAASKKASIGFILQPLEDGSKTPIK